jgi:hypothetical protein
MGSNKFCMVCLSIDLTYQNVLESPRKAEEMNDNPLPPGERVGVRGR